LVIVSKAKIEMPANSLLQKFIAPFVILLSGSLLAFSWWIQYSLEKHFEQTVEEDLIGRIKFFLKFEIFYEIEILDYSCLTHL